MVYLVVMIVLAGLVIEGFMRVIAYFADWLGGGEKLDDERVERAAKARAESNEVLDEQLAATANERGRVRRKSRARASKMAVEEYLDHMHLGWYQIVIIFFIGCMAGLLIEEIWMYATQGRTENRVGLVWGPFSPLYGTGAVLLTLFCFQMRRHGAKNWQVFLLSLVVGGVLEQVTGWVMEEVFGVISWTYEALPDHITKWVAWRMLVLWGFLGLAWCRLIMPRLLYQIGMPTTKRQALFVTLTAVYLVVDIGLTLACFSRAAAREEGVEAQNAFEEWVDTNFDDEFIASRFQNLRSSEEG